MGKWILTLRHGIDRLLRVVATSANLEILSKQQKAVPYEQGVCLMTETTTKTLQNEALFEDTILIRFPAPLLNQGPKPRSGSRLWAGGDL